MSTKKIKDIFDFSEDEIKIKIAQFGGHLLLSNGSRIKAIDARETPYIKERFGIDKWVNLQQSMSQSQLQELWSTYS